MSLTEQLQTDMITAMRDGDTLRRDTLRMVMAAAQHAAKAKRAPLTDDETLEVIAREVKQRRESVQAYTGAGRHDLAAAEQAEIDMLLPYLPSQLGDAEIRVLAAEAVASTGATSQRDLGRVMAQLMPKVKGRADGKVVNAIVTEELARAAGA